jgi:hypothetical protein
MELDLFGRNYALDLNAREMSILRRPIAEGQWGGHQHFEAELQTRLDAYGRLMMTEPELIRAFKFAWGYGNGTWQQYMRAVVNAALRVGWHPPTEPNGDDKLAAAIARYFQDVQV